MNNTYPSLGALLRYPGWRHDILIANAELHKDIAHENDLADVEKLAQKFEGAAVARLGEKANGKFSSNTGADFEKNAKVFKEVYNIKIVLEQAKKKVAHNEFANEITSDMDIVSDSGAHQNDFLAELYKSIIDLQADEKYHDANHSSVNETQIPVEEVLISIYIRDKNKIYIPKPWN